MREVLIIVSVTEAHDRTLWTAEASGRNSLSAQESYVKERESTTLGKSIGTVWRWAMGRVILDLLPVSPVGGSGRNGIEIILSTNEHRTTITDPISSIALSNRFLAVYVPLAIARS